MEGRAPLSGQLVTRQTYLPSMLLEKGVQTIYVDAGNPDAYDTAGRIRNYTTYGAEDPLHPTLEPGSYAWRLRDPVWVGGDPSAYPNGQGYNSELARTELATRRGFARALSSVGLDAYGVEIMDTKTIEKRHPEGLVFIKPDRISDVSANPEARARLVRSAGIRDNTSSEHVIQKYVTPMAAQKLADHLGATTALPETNDTYLNTVRIFTPLWTPPGSAPAVELRITNPRTDIGALFATHQYLLEPEHVRTRLPELTKLHDNVHAAFAARYGEQNYLTFDYIILPDGSAKVLNGLVRALTPNLEHQRPEVQHLANATADVEVRHLAKLALGS